MIDRNQQTDVREDEGWLYLAVVVDGHAGQWLQQRGRREFLRNAEAETRLRTLRSASDAGEDGSR